MSAFARTRNGPSVLLHHANHGVVTGYRVVELQTSMLSGRACASEGSVSRCFVGPGWGKSEGWNLRLPVSVNQRLNPSGRSSRPSEGGELVASVSSQARRHKLPVSRSGRQRIAPYLHCRRLVTRCNAVDVMVQREMRDQFIQAAKGARVHCPSEKEGPSCQNGT